jgi:transposase
LDKRAAIVLQQKVTRHQLGRRLNNISRCLIGMETCSETHFIARQLAAHGRFVSDPSAVRETIPKGHKNDYRDGAAVWPIKPVASA